MMPVLMRWRREGRGERGERTVNLSRNGYWERFTKRSASYQLMWVTALSLLTEKT